MAQKGIYGASAGARVSGKAILVFAALMSRRGLSCDLAMGLAVAARL
jgi:hypothetical protein